MNNTHEQPLQIVDSLIYRISDADGINTDEINVTMWGASRNLSVRAEGARRVLACVNACAGIDTDELESLPRGLLTDPACDQYAADNATLRAALQTQAEEAAKLMAQRDDYADALRALMEWQVINVDKWNNEAYDYAAATIKKHSAAITNATL